MIKVRFLVLKLKKIFIPFCIFIFTLFLVVFSNTNLESAKYGIKIWAQSVVPSLFPFFIATELLGYTNIIYFLGKIFNKLMRPTFNVPGEGSFPLIMGIVSGYPVGAKIVANLKNQGKITNIEAERLIAFTNNSGPLFILGTVGLGLYKNTYIGNLLLITHILAGITVGFIFRWWKRNKKGIYINSLENSKKTKEISLANLGDVLSISIMNAINTTMLIGGFIVLFSVVISMLYNSGILGLLSNSIKPVLHTFKISSSFANGIISGLIELTNGVFKISLVGNINQNISIIICAFLLGFGGLSITLQILSIISKAKISIKPYIIGKLLQGVLAAVYTFIYLFVFSSFY